MPEPNPNLLVFERPVTLELEPPPAPTGKLPLRPIAKQLRIRGGMHRLGREPIRTFRKPLPEGFVEAVAAQSMTCRRS